MTTIDQSFLIKIENIPFKFEIGSALQLFHLASGFTLHKIET